MGSGLNWLKDRYPYFVTGLVFMRNLGDELILGKTREWPDGDEPKAFFWLKDWDFYEIGDESNDYRFWSIKGLYCLWLDCFLMDEEFLTGL